MSKRYILGHWDFILVVSNTMEYGNERIRKNNIRYKSITGTIFPVSEGYVLRLHTKIDQSYPRFLYQKLA